jgi:undecaprenyl-diphosphatase
LGLQLTTLLAALSVGLYVLISYTGVIGGDPSSTGADRTAIDVVEHIREGWLTDVAEAITTLGAAYVTLPIAALAAIALGAIRRWTEVAVLVIGMTLIVIVTHELKVEIDRPRPPDPIVSVDGSAFPSAHASYATVYAFLAATIAWRISPRLTQRSLLIAAGIVLTALVGLTRVYLGVHFLSDVSAGWALGVSAFTATAAAALVISHIRQNARTDARPRPESA